MNLIRWFARAPLFLLAISIISGFMVPSAGVQASPLAEKEPLEPGLYDGTFIYSIEHAYNKPKGDLTENSYKLRAEDAMGSLRFRVNEAGTVTGVSIHFLGFYYSVNETQTINVPEGSQGQYHCTGSTTRGAGVGSVSGGSGSSTAPPLVPSGIDYYFYTREIKLNAGDPWAYVRLKGKCPPVDAKSTSKKAVEAVKWDIDSVPSGVWYFSVTWQGLTSAGGTCTTDGWSTGERSMSCYWAAYSNGYKRMTAPGP